MKRLYLFLGACMMLVAGIAHAMDGVFDRSQEVEKYLVAIKTGTRGAVIDAGKEIFNSGISDTKLAMALNERLLADFKSVDQFDGVGEKYVEWMVKALASNGIIEYAATIERVGKEGHMQTRKYCQEERAKIPWYRARNDIMASRKNHNEGDDPNVSRMINLVQADDFSYKQYAADRMNWARMLDPRLMDAVDQQVLLHIDSTTHSASRDQAKAMGMFIKLLGYSGNVKFRDTMQRVKASKATSLMKKYADESLGRLQT